MYSLRTQERLDAKRNHASSRQTLWKNLSNKNKSGRMVRRIYKKTREEMTESCRTRRREWINNANADIRSWIREPQPSASEHTFRDRKPEAEIGPSNGHISGRKYIPRLVFCGGGEIDRDKTADLMETLLEPSRMRGNDPNALQNPCRPTVVFTDTAKIRGRVEHPHWEPPRYFLRPREKSKEIGPDVQYADRNDMQRMFTTVVKNSLFAWGAYEERGTSAAPSCRHEDSEKWIGDRPFFPGYRFRDNQREGMAGTTFPPDLINAGDYRPPREFSRDRHPSKELPRHGRFRLVVKNGEYACPDGITRRSLRYEEAPPDSYPEDKMYLASLRSVAVNPTTGNLRRLDNNPPRQGALLRKSHSLGTLCRGAERQPLVGEVAIEKDARGGNGDVQSEGGRFQATSRSRAVGVRPLSISRSSTAVRFAGTAMRSQSEGVQEQDGDANDVGDGDLEAERAVGASNCTTQERSGCDEKTSGNMRRGSEMASWAVCGTREKSARDYLW